MWLFVGGQGVNEFGVYFSGRELNIVKQNKMYQKNKEDEKLTQSRAPLL